MLAFGKEYTPILPLAIFRIGFGALMFISVLRTILKGWVQEFYVDPILHFHYFGFAWLPEPTEFQIYSLFAIALLSALGVCFAYHYRLSTLLFFLSFTYIELLDVSYYLNHYYFVSLVSFALIFLPANRMLSFDLRFRKINAVAHIPRLYLLIPRLLVGGLYFMAGVAKLNADWLFEALPLKIWLPAHSDFPIVGQLLNETWVAYAFSWFGAGFDLSVPFLLSNKKTRKWSYTILVLFHFITWLLFPIGMFPWVMMISALVFFNAEELNRIFKVSFDQTRFIPKPYFRLQAKFALALVTFALFLFPFRYTLYPSHLFWHEQGYRFSWRVMLMEKAGKTFFYVQDPSQPGKKEISNTTFLTPIQEKQMSTQPDLILQFAHFLDDYYVKQGISDPIVTVQSYVSLNGRGSRLFIDPNTDLSKIEDSWSHKEWILPFEQPEQSLKQQEIAQ